MRRRRIIGAVIVLIVAIGVVVGAAAAIHHYSSGELLVVTAEAGRVRPRQEGHDPRGLRPPRRSPTSPSRTASRGDYLKASESFKGFDPAKYGAQSPPSLEGFLFPATYDLPRQPTVDDLVARQLDAFKQNIAQVDMGYAQVQEPDAPTTC